MERFVTSGVQNRKSLRIEPGKNCRVEDFAQERALLRAARSGLIYVPELSLALSSGIYPSKAAEELSEGRPLLQLEMLEAELTNQGILASSSEHPFSLVRQALHETDVWRWRARRLGFDAKQLRFLLCLPHYVVFYAEQLLNDLESASEGTSRIGSQSWHHRYDKQSGVLHELKYLERCAAYLCGAFENTEDRYQRGLNLVLKAICLGSRQATTDDEQGLLTMTLPLRKQDFYAALRESKER